MSPARQGLVPRSGDASVSLRRRVVQILQAAGLLGPLAVVALSLVMTLVTILLHWRFPVEPWPRLACLLFLAAGGLAFVIMVSRLRGQLLNPLVRLEEAVGRVCQGEPGASETLRDAGVLDGIARDIGTLNGELTDLYEDMDSRVRRQTRRLAQKTASLKILYDVAAGIHEVQTTEDLLLRFLRVLKEMVNGRAATVRLVMPDGARRLIGSIGLDDDLARAQDMAPVDLCLCGSVLSAGDIVCHDDARFCSKVYGRKMFASDEMEVVTVPLEHHAELLGLYTIFVDRPGVTAREDIMRLLFTVGHHIGVAVAKQRSDVEAHRLSIVEERNSLAHELHDSLAQTLASLRFQFRMLDDSLADCAIPQEARNDLSRVAGGLDEAHTELRELLVSFRAPMDRRGLVPALEKLTQRLGRETGLYVFFQNDCRPFELTAMEELQIMRIVQEALTNIRKHARAHTVRVLLTRAQSGALVLLVEDDGVGFDAPAFGGSPGEHIGLSIMEERARRIGAEMRIESEVGEGTRVEVLFVPRSRSGRNAPEAA